MTRVPRPTTVLAVALLACPALAVETAADDGLDLLEGFLDDVETMSADFEQSLVDANDVVVENSSGSLWIRRPGEFQWRYREPYEQLLVADGTNIWSYDVDLEQVTVRPQAEMLANTPATLLGGSREVLEEFHFVGSETDERGTVWLTLTPRNIDNGFTRVELGFDSGTLRRMIFSDSLEQTTLIALLDVEVNTSLDDELFRFSVPPGVDLVGQPLVTGNARP